MEKLTNQSVEETLGRLEKTLARYRLKVISEESMNTMTTKIADLFLENTELRVKLMTRNPLPMGSILFAAIVFILGVAVGYTL